MTTPDPAEFIAGKHWADVIGCDTRATLREIQKAAGRRAVEAMDRLRGPQLSAALLELGAAIDAATAARPDARRRREIDQ